MVCCVLIQGCGNCNHAQLLVHGHVGHQLHHCGEGLSAYIRSDVADSNVRKAHSLKLTFALTNSFNHTRAHRHAHSRTLSRLHSQSLHSHSRAHPSPRSQTLNAHSHQHRHSNTHILSSFRPSLYVHVFDCSQHSGCSPWCFLFRLLEPLRRIARSCWPSLTLT